MQVIHLIVAHRPGNLSDHVHRDWFPGNVKDESSGLEPRIISHLSFRKFCSVLLIHLQDRLHRVHISRHTLRLHRHFISAYCQCVSFLSCQSIRRCQAEIICSRSRRAGLFLQADACKIFIIQNKFIYDRLKSRVIIHCRRDRIDVQFFCAVRIPFRDLRYNTGLRIHAFFLHILPLDHIRNICGFLCIPGCFLCYDIGNLNRLVCQRVDDLSVLGNDLFKVRSIQFHRISFRHLGHRKYIHIHFDRLSLNPFRHTVQIRIFFMSLRIDFELRYTDIIVAGSGRRKFAESDIFRINRFIQQDGYLVCIAAVLLLILIVFFQIMLFSCFIRILDAEGLYIRRHRRNVSLKEINIDLPDLSNFLEIGFQPYICRRHLIAARPPVRAFKFSVLYLIAIQVRRFIARCSNHSIQHAVHSCLFPVRCNAGERKQAD